MTPDTVAGLRRMKATAPPLEYFVVAANMAEHLADAWEHQ